MFLSMADRAEEEQTFKELLDHETNFIDMGPWKKYQYQEYRVPLVNVFVLPLVPTV